MPLEVEEVKKPKTPPWDTTSIPSAEETRELMELGPIPQAVVDFSVPLVKSAQQDVPWSPVSQASVDIAQNTAQKAISMIHTPFEANAPEAERNKVTDEREGRAINDRVGRLLEYAITLPNITDTEAQRIVERANKAIRDHGFTKQTEADVLIDVMAASIGIPMREVPTSEQPAEAEEAPPTTETTPEAPQVGGTLTEKGMTLETLAKSERGEEREQVNGGLKQWKHKEKDDTKHKNKSDLQDELPEGRSGIEGDIYRNKYPEPEGGEGVSFNFINSGKVFYLGGAFGTEITPSLSAHSASENLSLEIDVTDGSVTVSTSAYASGSAPTNCIRYWITRNGIQVQNGDIHVTRAD